MLFFRSMIAGSLAALIGLVTTSAQQPAAALTIVRTLEGHKELVYTVNFSPDGQRLLTGSFDKSLKLWNVADGKNEKTYAGPSGHNDLVLTTAFSPDGRNFASGAKDNSIKLWDMPISGAFRDFAGVSAPALAEAVTPDGSKLAVGQQDGLIRIWTTSDGKQVAELKVAAAVHSLLVSPNGQWLAAGDAAGTVTLFNLADGKSLGQVAAHSKDVKGLGFHPNHQLLFTAGGEGQVKVWNLPLKAAAPAKAPEKAKTPEKTPAKKEEAKTKTPEKVPAKTPEKSKETEKTKPPVKPAATPQPDAIKPARSITAGTGPLLGMAILDGGNRAVVATSEGIAKIYNLTNGNLDKELKGHAGAIEAVAATANSQVIFTAGVDKTVRAFSAVDGKELKKFAEPAGAKALATQANWLVAGQADGSITVLNIAITPGQAPNADFGKVLHGFKQAGPVTSVSLPSSLAIIYTASNDKSVKSWKLAGDMPLRNLAGHGNLIDAVAYSPDGLTLVSTSHDGTIRFWNPSDGKQTGDVKLNAQPLYCVAWRADGKQVAVGSFDRSVRFIDVAGKKVEREIKCFDDKSAPNGHGDAVYSVAYTPAGQLYAAGADGKIKLWNPADGAMVKELIDPTLKDKAQRDFINTIKLNKDGSRLVAVGNGGWITIWNTADGKLLHSQKLPVQLYGLSISPDGKLIATGNINGTVYLIQMP
jgi:WD40 repeat protein